MSFFHIKLQFCKLHQLNVPTFKRYCTVPKPTNIASKKYSDTIILPKTKFPPRITSKKRLEHETTIAANCQFENLYGLQRLWRTGQPEYILHDGPPYANGDAHIGHAVNKILKDITNRYKLLRGYQINYVPGWDCHGLPIEQKALKENAVYENTIPNNPLVIRANARKVAQECIEKQMTSFRRWGIMAEWNNSYKTFDKNYIKAELQLFYELFQKNYIYRAQKPIFWSPSSRSALAEAELEYNANHTSTAVYLGLPLCSNVASFASTVGQQLPSDMQKERLELPVSVVIWTTTPWSLPSNAAVAFNESLKYTLLRSEQAYDTVLYIVATACIPELQATTNKAFTPMFEFEGSQLTKFQYKHPWFQDRTCPFVHGAHVTTEKGTGLVHTAPAHGTDDYVLALQHNLPIDCYINDDGSFDDTIQSLKGMSAMSLGTTKVVNTLQTQILRHEKYIHSYPYDWRTKKPVIVKTSMQWFMDTKKIKSAAVKALEGVSIYPPNVQHCMLSQLVDRPYWCISRQRAWGVPIPVLFHKETGEPLIEKGVIDRLCDLAELTGSVDAWWEMPVGTLLQNDDLASQYEKGKDIFDIWLDSGVSWHLIGDKVADLYLEGVDQFNGWFHSSLLTSVALRGVAPYKNLYVHGFVVDESGKKMSKSLGNVVDPKLITDGNNDGETFGADVLRWWCATQGSSDSSKIAMYNNLLNISDTSIQKIRNTLKFIVSFCTTESLKELEIEDVSYDELMHIDQYMLSLLRTFQQEILDDYDNYNYHRTMNRTLHFVATEVSTYYFSWIKDRLYCDFKESQSRKSCIFVLNEIYLTLTKTLAPVLPYLCEEVHSYYNGEESIYKSTWGELNAGWENVHVCEMMDLALDVRSTVNQISGSQNSKTLWAQIICNETAYQTLQMLHPTKCSEVEKCTSELCDILQVSGVDLQCSADKNFTIESFGVGHSLGGFSVAVGKTEMFQCHRCRRYCCTEGNSCCSRCQSVLKRLQQQPPQNASSSSESVEREVPVSETVKEEILIRT